ncbi:MAG: DUF2723 domain-containing protein [Prolixibacteraceae bacterium]
MTFNQKNNLFGWGIFLSSLLVYLLTLEPTMSLWDCGEFLVSACKLEISHAPGAPLFMLIGRIFSLAALGDHSRAAAMVNLMSAVSAAATVMFLFWTAVWLMKGYLSTNQAAVWLSSAIGALGFAFTDSFWFSAVEAEVYSMSSLFIAIVLWAATRWEREAGEPAANRWILLIFFLTGLSIGVHLLNLLVIPTVALIIFSRHYSYSIRGTLLTLAGSFALILFIMKIYIPGLFSLSGPLEFFMINTLNLPVNSGFYCYLALIVVFFIWAVRYTQMKKKANWNLAVLCLLFLTLGYTSYLTVFIRSAANPPVDQGSPETTFSLINYLNRESYGTRPFLFGESFGSEAVSYEERITRVYNGHNYVPVELNPKVQYYPGMVGFFPRMHSRDENHIEAYRQWTNMKGKKVSYKSHDGVTKTTVLPTFGENLRFFLNYQLGHMYLRYFMWNFAGRQNDIQGFGGPLNGNWLSGITFIDEYRLGPQKNLPGELLNNKGRNRYYFLPLILGVAGCFFHYRREKKTFSSFFLLFLMMGVSLVVYLNEVPDTPRERDYVYVGSFYVFSIWIGIGVLALFDFLERLLNRKTALILAATAGTVAAPAILLLQNYDDHDRSGRYTGRDLARNYLMSCEPDAILFTHADNDTYPLWYCQEVEGIRRDVRVIVMPYLAANWYLRQINRTVYDNPGVELTIPVIKYETGKVNYLPVVPRIKAEQDMRDVLSFVASDSANARVELQNGEMIPYIPVKNARILLSGDSIRVDLDKPYLSGNDLAFWDILASNAGGRPVCFTSWSDPEHYGLEDHLRFDGLVYTLIADVHRSESPLDMGKVDPEKLCKNLMENCNWENMKDSAVYFDWHHRRMFAVTQIRHAFYRLAESLIQNKRADRARRVIEEAMTILPFRLWPVDYYSCLLNDALLKSGKDAGGIALLKKQAGNLEEWLDYLRQFEGGRFGSIEQEYTAKLYLYRELYRLAVEYDPGLAEAMKHKFEGYLEVVK